MSENDSPDDPQAEFLALRQELGKTLGFQTVDFLIERAAVEIGQAYPSLRSISVLEGELNLESVATAFQDATSREVESALRALTAVMLLLLSRSVGHAVTEALAETTHSSFQQGLLEP